MAVAVAAAAVVVLVAVVAATVISQACAFLLDLPLSSSCITCNSPLHFPISDEAATVSSHRKRTNDKRTRDSMPKRQPPLMKLYAENLLPSFACSLPCPSVLVLSRRSLALPAAFVFFFWRGVTTRFR
ncbi:hypothetical protein CALCODRAFT_180671 [Calocera cornea HHB12733]|uniref:Secreted peptide n=1 Tax=Calocera cornea HHB12733 TaxID=1353952 RepID=A0A165CC36_9BASI|nr:hypothetical protein CALCODRAFT_180671 [Calocera cornea HHB12733]